MKMVVVQFSVSTYICTHIAQKKNEIAPVIWENVRTSWLMDVMVCLYKSTSDPQAEEKKNLWNILVSRLYYDSGKSTKSSF